MPNAGEFPPVPSPRCGLSDTISVVIASDRQKSLLALLTCLEGESDLSVSGEPVRKPEHLLSSLESRLPDLLLVDRRLLNQLGSRLTRSIHAKFPDLRVLLLCNRSSSKLVHEIILNRFHGFLIIGRAHKICVNAIRSVCQGELWVPRRLLEKAILDQSSLVNRYDVGSDFDVVLTPREAQSVAYLRRGFTNMQIGGELGVKEDTVKKHLRSAYVKLGVSRRTELMALYAPVRPISD